MNKPEWLTVDEVAEELRVHPDSVRRWIRAGELKAFGTSTRSGYRIRRSELERFIEEHSKGFAVA
jgi:excisionase family DNA binding protein